MSISILVSVDSSKISRGIDLIAPQGIPAFCITQERTFNRLAYNNLGFLFFYSLTLSMFSKRERLKFFYTSWDLIPITTTASSVIKLHSFHLIMAGTGWASDRIYKQGRT